MCFFDDAAQLIEDDRNNGTWTPHVKLEFDGYVWTSVHLALRRPLHPGDTRGMSVAEWRAEQYAVNEVTVSAG